MELNSGGRWPFRSRIAHPGLSVHYKSLNLLSPGSCDSLRSHERASLLLVWPVWFSTACEKSPYSTSTNSSFNTQTLMIELLESFGSVFKCLWIFEFKHVKHKVFVLCDFRCLLVVGMAYKWGESSCLWDEVTNWISTNWTSGGYKCSIILG